MHNLFNIPAFTAHFGQVFLYWDTNSEYCLHNWFWEITLRACSQLVGKTVDFMITLLWSDVYKHLLQLSRMNITLGYFILHILNSSDEGAEHSTQIGSTNYDWDGA